MLRTFAALLVAAFAGAASAAPITYAFYQGGYDEGAFVAGYFVGEDLNGDGRLTYDGIRLPDNSVRCNSCELLSYFMLFSGNSFVRPFTQSGVDVFAMKYTGDADDKTGFEYTLGSLTMPGQPDQTTCNPQAPDGCYDFNGDWLRAWDSRYFTIDGELWFDTGTQWRVNYFQTASGLACFVYAICGRIEDRAIGSPTYFGSSLTSEWMQIYRVTEPGTLALLGLGLAGLALARRRKQQPIA